jgi:mannose-1-phosphate guanylyltransferase
VGDRFFSVATLLELASASEERFAHHASTRVEVTAGTVVMTDRDVPTGSRRDVRSVHRWGVVLAGGDGIRLRELTRLICGDDRPKQFCPLLSERTLLQEARRRAERTIPVDQIFYSLNLAHHPYYHFDLADRSSHRIIQPCNRGTAPAIISALLHISSMDPYAVVAILPCDHYYSKESWVSAALGLALAAAEAHPESLVLLGAPPRAPEVDYGWIVLGDRVPGPEHRVFEVQGFWEKPTYAIAQNLFRNRCLWNTFVMAGHVHTFLEMADASAPGLMYAFRSTPPAMSAAGVQVADNLYRSIAPVDFAHSVLSANAGKLIAVPLADPSWDDLGSPKRVIEILLQNGRELPAWAGRWREQAERVRETGETRFPERVTRSNL